METRSDRLRDWLTASGMNVPELSRRSGVPEASIYKYLKGRTAAPRGKILADLAGVFGQSAVQLAYGNAVASPAGVVNIPLLSMNEMGTYDYASGLARSGSYRSRLCG